MKIRLLIVAILLIPAGQAIAQTDTRAASSGDVGEIAFANSGSPAAQADFLRGLALLHNFEYADAAASFRKAQETDPDFVMAYWGEAMTFTHPVWMQQDLAAARAELGRLGSDPAARAAKAKSNRERDYLHTVEVLYGDGTKEERDFKFADAMAVLHERYPGDVDATAFYALSLLGTAHHGRDFGIYMRSAALLEEVFPAHLHHPGVLHYLIHSYDDPIHAPLGMRAARLYGQVAPNAGHALHMTTHIFVALGMWDEVIAANRRAIDVVNRRRAAKSLPPSGCGHYQIWLEYGYLQERRIDEAKQVLDGCRAAAIAAGARPGQTPVEPEDSQYGSFVEMRLLFLVESGKWNAADAVPLPDPIYVLPQFAATYGDALAAFRAGDASGLRKAVVALHEQEQGVLAAIEQRKLTNPSYRQRIAVILKQVDALEMLAGGKRDEGLTALRKAADAESGMSFEFGPPVVEKPSLELLGEQLLAAGRAGEAEPAFESSLRRTPGRTSSLEGLLRAQKALGHSEAAARTAGLLARNRPAARAESLP
jgi:tetratricopeptide (TPR) repeat protein